MSADDSRPLADDPPPTDDQEKFPVRVSDALIGEAIGLVLIYVGTRISYWILRWLVIGVGLSFIGVMSAFLIAVSWEKVSPRVRLITSRVRGHQRKDPQLGTLIRDVKSESWEGSLTVGDRAVRILIDGHEEPEPALVARAREIVADFNSLERRLTDYLAQTAKEWAPEAPELAAQVAELRVSGILLLSSRPPGDAVIELDGPDEDIYWTCEYEGGEFGALDHD